MQFIFRLGLIVDESGLAFERAEAAVEDAVVAVDAAAVGKDEVQLALWTAEFHSGGKIAILYQDDDYGKDYVKGLKDGLGTKGQASIIAEAVRRRTPPSIPKSST